MKRLRRWVWGWVARALLVLLAPALWLRPKLRPGWGQRLGFYAGPAPEGTPRLWLHGASAGDVKALLPLARAARARWPQAAVILTTRTTTGFAMAQKTDLFPTAYYAPWDLPGAQRRAFAHLRPDVLVLEYTELWPQQIWTAGALGVPVVLHNGTLSPGRERGYRWLMRATGNILAELSALLMRDADHAERARRLGAVPERVHITGTTKLDDLPPVPSAAQRAGLRGQLRWSAERPVVVWGSVHRDEEALALRVMGRLREEVPEVAFVLAPRYPERGAAVAAAADARGWATRRRSSSAPEVAAPEALILDTVGELAAWYGAGNAAVVGGSFIPRGGHNIIEPAACAVPVLYGPYDVHVRDAARLLGGAGVEQVSSEAELVARLGAWLRDLPACAHKGAQARARLQEAGGAAERNLDHIAGLVVSRASST